jgi:hypothetical protein
MKRITRSVFLLFGLMNAAYADELFTAPLPAIFVTNDVHCNIVNISGRARVVTIEVLGPDGGRAAGLDQWILEPMSIAGIESNGNRSPSYCKFTVEGSAKHYRAGIAVLKKDMGYTAALPAFSRERED